MVIAVLQIVINYTKNNGKAGGTKGNRVIYLFRSNVILDLSPLYFEKRKDDKNAIKRKRRTYFY